jgi:hypothetical protein
MRQSIVAVIGLITLAGAAAQVPVQQGDSKKVPPLNEKIKSADLIIVGTVTQTGLSVASSFDVGSIEAKEMLKGDVKIKSANFRFSDRQQPAYAKKGVQGVWVLGKKGGYLEAREVLAYLPLKELMAVKDILAELNEKKENPPQEAGKGLTIYAQVQWNGPAPKQQLVLRSGAELAKAFPPPDLDQPPQAAEKRATEAIAKALKVAGIDWKKQMLVVLAYGKSTNFGPSLKFTRLEVHNGKLTVNGEHRLPGEVSPDKGGTYLTQIALVDRFDGPVEFKIKVIALP